jgi:peptidyl-prolyl cis-trans isomerase SurA
MIKTFLFAGLLFGQIASAKLLDKIAGVINDQVITLSELKRVRANFSSRKEISPAVYKDVKPNLKSLLDHQFRIFIINKKLSEIGYIVSDASVENRIEYIEKLQNVQRSDLINFLNGKNLTYEEYFAIIKATMEFQQFNQKVLQPLVSITDQEIKNFYFSQIGTSSKVSFVYNLVSFNISKNQLQGISNKKLISDLNNLRKTGKSLDYLESLDTKVVNEINETNLNKVFSQALRNTDEGKLSQPVTVGDNVFVFFVKSKNLTESEDYIRRKNNFKKALMEKKSFEVLNKWFDSEKGNFFIKSFL